MTKENLEIYQEVFPKSQLRRMKVVDEYLNTFGEMIKKKVISPNCARYKSVFRVDNRSEEYFCLSILL